MDRESASYNSCMLNKLCWRIVDIGIFHPSIKVVMVTTIMLGFAGCYIFCILKSLDSKDFNCEINSK